MIDDAFPQLKPKHEMTQEEIEGLIEVKIDRNVLLKDLLEVIESNHWARYALTPEFDLILTTRIHNALASDMGVNRYDWLVTDGNFRVDFFSHSIEFDYVYGREPGKGRRFKDAAENKVITFLKSKGMDVRSNVSR